MLSIERGERFEARRGGEERARVADEHVPMRRQGGKRGGAFLRRRGETVGRFTDAGLKRRRDDRAIAGAAAEIARKLVAKPCICRGLGGMIGGEQAHHDPGRAEAALRGVRIDHRLLQRMQFAA